MSAGDAVAAALPRVLVARAAITAAATRKALQATSAAWNPPVRACAVFAWAAIRWVVRLVAIAVRIARPSAAPTVDEVVIERGGEAGLVCWDAGVGGVLDADHDGAESERHDDESREQVGQVGPVNGDS